MLNDYSISCMKYPTRVIFIDDDIEQLKSLRSIFSKLYDLCEYYSDFEVAADLLSQYNSPHFVLDRSLLKEEVAGKYSPVLMNNKTKEISIIVTDYRLNQGASGLELLKKVKDKNIFRVLYTGVADEKIAIKAFNNGEIDAYFKKSEKADYLVTIVEQGITRYFKNISYNLMNMLNQRVLNESALLDVEFCSYFQNILYAKKIIEFYLIDDSGSYILISSNKKQYTLLVMHKDTIEAQLEALEEIKELNMEIIDISNANKMLYINNIFYNQKSAKKLLFDCDSIGKNKQFLYCFLQDNPLGINLGS